MWIKSQDRETLGQYTEIQVIGNKIVGFHHMGTDLGEYESKERAKEIFHKIQGFLVNGTKEDVLIGNIRTTKEKVFYMPLK